MPKSLYVFYRCGFFLLSSSSSFLLFRLLISDVTERISTKRGHVFSYDCYLKNLVRTPRAFTPMGWGGKNRYFGTDFEL